MKHRTTTEKRLERINMKMMQDKHGYDDSNPEHMDPKAYSRFKAFNTDYGSGKKCAYGDKQKTCDPGCRFWMSCIKGRQGKEDTTSEQCIEKKE